MMSTKLPEEKHHFLYKIAQAYYEDELTQQEIANRFHLSRSKVSRLLQEARSEGVVSIDLVAPPSGLADLEHELESKFGLQEALIVSVGSSQDLGLVKRELGPAAAKWLVRSLSGDEVLAMAWGMSLLAMVDALPARSWPDLTIVQMMGGMGSGEGRQHSYRLITRAADRFGANPRLVQAPGVVSSKATAEALKSNSQIADALSLAAKADIAVVGLGLLSPDTLLLREGDILVQRDIDTLTEANAVGDIALRYFDADGIPIELDINQRTVGLTLEQIKRIPCVMGIAGGKAKLEVIRGALRGSLLNVLVTDHSTAQSLLSGAKVGPQSTATLG